jgi:uncharacterized protein involved in exopolysaccharide biosynthesis
MLQRQTFNEIRPDEDSGQALTPLYFFEILKRRALYFAIPFAVILAIGSLIALAWPARYLSQGTILVSSQQIPSELVRSTVSTVANERIQIIEQRIMTRDNLLALAKKYQLTAGLQERMSGTEIVDFIKSRFKIKAAEQKMATGRKDAMIFTVGFEYEQPQIATRVANDFVTMILDEDVRARTAYAAETSRFLAEDVKKLEAQLTALSAQISEQKRRRVAALNDSGEADDGSIAALRAQLLIKSATYSDTHPEIRALKRRIELLEKGGAVDGSKKGATPDPSPTLETLLTQDASLKAQLTAATQKLAMARLGENLERGQISERLEVLEQPTLPQKPTSPNRPKIFAAVFVLALMAGGGLVFAAESLNPAIRRSSDLYSIIDSHLIVSIPYITTQSELSRKKKLIILGAGMLVVLALAGVIAAFFFLPPIDILFEKLMGKVLGK